VEGFSVIDLLAGAAQCQEAAAATDQASVVIELVLATQSTQKG